MSEVCKNGHTRTEENTTLVQEKARNRVRKTCLDCRRKGGPSTAELSGQRRRERIEDIEDLIRFGSTFEEIVERSYYANWERMSRVLREAGRQDLLDTLRMKRK